MTKTVLIVDAFPLEIREQIEAQLGEHGFGRLFASILRSNTDADLNFQTIDGIDEGPDAEVVAGFDGFIWSGSSLSVLDDSDEIATLTNWMSLCIETGQPIFGICFGLQLAAKMAGGVVEKNPKGLETLVARNIVISNEGKNHPMMAGRTGSYDAIADHGDQISQLPEGGICLAGNEISQVQAAAFKIGASEFWGVQYHPDMDLNILRMLLPIRKDQLLSDKFFDSEDEYAAYLALVDRLIAKPDATDVARELQFKADILDTAPRLAEVECWIQQKILRQNT